MIKTLRFLLPVAVLVAGAGVLRWQLDTRPVLPLAERPDPAPLVEVLTLQPEDRQLQVVAHGEIEGLAPLPLAAEVGGRVIESSPNLVEGGSCNQGDLLFRLEDTDYRLSLAAAEAAVAQARAALELEEAAAELALADWAELGDGEPSALVRREPQLAAARAELQAREAARDQAQRDLTRCEVRAPFAARIEAAELALGQLVTPGVAVATLTPTAAAELRLPIALQDLAFLDLDLGARELSLPLVLRAEVGGQLLEREARIERVRPALDPANRMLHAIAMIDDPYALHTDAPPVAPGLFVTANIAGSQARGVYAVPRHAMHEGGVVHLADADGRLQVREVEVLQWTSELALVSDGLAAGERLVLTALPVVAPGMRLEVREASR